MNKIKFSAPIIAIVLILASITGCAPQIDEAAGNVAKNYYTYAIVRQDMVTANSDCAFDKVALTEELYTVNAKDEGITLDEYIKNLAETRKITADINSVADYLEALSLYYIDKNIDSMGADYFSPNANVVEFKTASSSEIQTTYDSLMSKYSLDGVDFSKYLNFADITEGMTVTVGENDNNTTVLLVKINGNWKFLA